jgi:hypothetical protein
MRKNSMKALMAICSIFAVSIVICGCATTIGTGASGSTQQSGTAMAKTLKFDDVPVPPGFKLLDNESFTFQNDQMRVGLLKYTGMPNANKAVEFYKTEMPMYNWDLINVIEYEQKVMNFERIDQTCIITIQPEATRTVIAIAVAPKSNTAMTQERVQKYKELKDEHYRATGIK